MGPFPGRGVGLAPEPPIIGRTRVGVERHGVVGPHAAGPQTIAPFRHEPGVVARDLEEVGLDERHGPAGMDQPFGEIFGRHAAALVERRTALDRETLDPGFDRDAARRPQEVEHVRLPEIDAGLDAEFDRAGHQRFEQRPLRQEDLVDEIDVSCALGHEAVDLDQHGVEIALPVFVAKIDLGAERAMVRATPGGLDFGAGADGIAVVTVVVVVVPVDPGPIPAQRRGIGESAGRRVARDHGGTAVAIGDRRHAGETRCLRGCADVREPRHDLLAFTPHHDVAAELA